MREEWINDLLNIKHELLKSLDMYCRGEKYHD